MLNVTKHRCFNWALALCAGLQVFPIAVRADGASPEAATPTFSPGGGTYANSTQFVTIGSTTSGSSIAYTTDGSIPTESNGTITHGTLYLGAVPIFLPATLSAIAFKSGYLDSGVCIEGYTLQAAALAFSPVANDLSAIDLLPMVTATPTLNVLYNFSAASSGGINPPAGLVQGSDGNFYGTTNLGGVGNNGSVFKITTAGVLTTLVSLNGTNGADFTAGLILGSDGNFYGTTNGGGSSSDGTIFKMTPAGVLTTLVSFTGAANGAFPIAGLVQGSDGNFYGTADLGGGSSDGTVFQMTPAGVLTTLVSFTGAANGADPWGGLVQGSDGNFYGTTEIGGSSNLGTVFRITPTGTLTTLATFTGAANGANPEASLIQGNDGNFYGTTFRGGSSSDGTIFKMTPAGALTTWVTFTGTNGMSPKAGLVQDSYGNFYGTTNSGGSAGTGTIFMLTPAGVLTTLFSFTGTNGTFPDAGLVRGSDGNYYGTTLDGGSSNLGVVFQLVIPQAAAPVFSPAAGAVMSAQMVTITTTTGGASIAYTTDGTMPTERGGTVTHGTLYSGAVSISATTTLNAIAFENGFTDSPVTSGTYLFPIPAPAPAASGGGGGGSPSYWFYLALAALAAARYGQTRGRERRVGP